MAKKKIPLDRELVDYYGREFNDFLTIMTFKMLVSMLSENDKAVQKKMFMRVVQKFKRDNLKQLSQAHATQLLETQMLSHAHAIHYVGDETLSAFIGAISDEPNDNNIDFTGVFQ